MGRFIKEQPTLDFEGRRNLRNLFDCFYNSFSFCYPENPRQIFIELLLWKFKQDIVCLSSKLHSTSLMGAEHYPPPWFSVAPMMKWTDNHYRTLVHLISKKTWLYTEMLAAETIFLPFWQFDEELGTWKARNSFSIFEAKLLSAIKIGY